MYPEEGGWECGYTQWDAGILPSRASPPVDPTSPMCAPRDDNHNTPKPPPPERRRGFAFSQSGPASPGCPTYGVAVAVQGEDVGWSGRGRVRGRRARVESGEAGRQRGGRQPAPEARALHPGSRQVQLPSASFASGWAGKDLLPPRKTRPRRLSSPSKGTVTNNNNST